MKELKFRAWDKKKKKMILVDSIDFEGGVYYSTGPCINLEIYDAPCGQDDIPMKQVVLMQYTGLKDKNGKEIYEGDIIAIPDEEVVPILDDGSGPLEPFAHITSVIFTPLAVFGVKIEDGTSRCLLQNGIYSFYEIQEDVGISIDEIEVIGNIHKNPEFLE